MGAVRIDFKAEVTGCAIPCFLLHDKASHCYCLLMLHSLGTRRRRILQFDLKIVIPDAVIFKALIEFIRKG